MLDGIVSVRGGKLDESSSLCQVCIEANSDDDRALTVEDSPEQVPTLDEFIAEADPAVSVWSRRMPDWEDRDLRMAAAYGELATLYHLSGIWRDSDENTPLRDLIEAFLAGKAALRSRRDSLDFARIMQRLMSEPKGTDDRGGIDAQE